MLFSDPRFYDALAATNRITVNSSINIDEIGCNKVKGELIPFRRWRDIDKQTSGEDGPDVNRIEIAANLQGRLVGKRRVEYSGAFSGCQSVAVVGQSSHSAMTLHVSNERIAFTVVLLEINCSGLDEPLELIVEVLSLKVTWDWTRKIRPVRACSGVDSSSHSNHSFHRNTHTAASSRG